ncbi:MAG: branched-chain amino acid ABC transporter permease [Cryobacterium sp.]|nr:branched-chain amino acid ABC transporter permease [Cryobacterium sp.]
MTVELLVQQLINALSLGSIYALLALGLAVVYSVLGLLNFAYGEIITIAGYCMFFLVSGGMDFWYAAIFGVIAAIATSLLIQLVAFRPLRGAPANAVIFASFAVSIIIKALISNVISPRPRGIPVPSWVDGVIQLGSFRLPILALITIAIAVVAMVALTWALHYSTPGLAIRAAAEDFTVTRLMGAPAGRLILLAFVLSGILAGIAGVLWIARTGSVSPAMGFTPLLQSFIAIVLGGLGNLRGAVIGGFALAFIEVALQVLLPTAVVPFTAALTLVAVVVILYFRPQGFSKLAQERVA